MVAGFLQEVFASFQGEGLHVGRYHVFLRTAGCSLRCRFCDTPEALVRTREVRVHRGGRELHCEQNPVVPSRAAQWVGELDPENRAWVSLTGGEPLEQVAFLETLIPLLHPRSIYLETAGVHAEEMARLRPLVQFVAFDLKLHSVAQEGDRRGDHRRFLASCRGVERIAKAVVNPHLDLDELESLARLVAEEDRTIPLVLQPETPVQGGAPEISFALLLEAHDRVRRHLPEVRIIPQTHKFLRLP